VDNKVVGAHVGQVMARSDSAPGARWIGEDRAFNLSIYSRQAHSLTVLPGGEDRPALPLLNYRVLDSRVNKRWHIWHCRSGAGIIFGARCSAYENDGTRSSGPRNWYSFELARNLKEMM
jgi:hypothetical protein